MLLPPVGIASAFKRRLMLVGDARGQKRRQGNEAPEGLSSKLEGNICLWKETFHPFCLKLCPRKSSPSSKALVYIPPLPCVVLRIFANLSQHPTKMEAA